MAISGFAIGVWWLQRQPALPDTGLLIGGTILLGLALIAVMLLWPRPRGTRARVGVRVLLALLACICGASWSAWRAEMRLADQLPMAWESRDVLVTGVVDGLPRLMDGAVRFDLRVEVAEAPVPGRIQLSWYPPRGTEVAVPTIRPGERWQLNVRLKRPHGFVNPHGFDYEAWLLERNVRATGYVRSGDNNVRVTAFVPGAMNLVHRVRDSIRARFMADLAGADYAGILIALAIGDQRAIPNEQWEVFRRTAVAHLVSISGLHVSLVALIGGGAVGWSWRRVPRLMLRLPARKAAILAGLVCAAGYALLAGLGLPTQRALIMLTVAALAMLFGRETQGSRIMAVALLCVLLIDPWAVLSAGFWLSFGAVAIILYVLSGRLRVSSGWRAAVRIQIAITLATVPGLLVLFNAFSVVAPVANALAIPLVSFVIAPLSLLAIVLPAPVVLEIVHWVTGWMMRWLEWLAALPFAMWQQAATPVVLTLCALAAVVWLLLPRGAPARYMAVLAFAPLLLWSPPRPEHGAFRVVALDVGQGLAVHVQTHANDLLYDTGPPYGPVADAGSRVLLPYFVASGVATLHTMVISHGDSDHVGGAASVLASLPVQRFMSTPSEDHQALAASAGEIHQCVAGDTWQWDGIMFEVLHPAADEAPFAKTNDNSCVIRVSSKYGAVLLSGDIEAIAERSLVARHRDRLGSDVVIVPHHGSRTSSTPAFVRAVSAAHAIHVVGNLNRHRHPHPAVWARWSASGARNWRTDGQGAIVVDVGVDGVQVGSERERAPRYWHGR